MNSTRPLFGLVVCGGNSSRMGSDKSLISYHGEPQRYHLYKMLQAYCERVFISCNCRQLANIPGSYHVIVDSPAYKGCGPMSALLSAFEEYPEASFLVLACDYPNIKPTDIQKLTEARNPAKKAVAFVDSKTLIKEPLIAIYENDSYPKLLKNLAKGKLSLRSYLDECKELELLPGSHELFVNINTPEDLSNSRRDILPRQFQGNSFNLEV